MDNSLQTSSGLRFNMVPSTRPLNILDLARETLFKCRNSSLVSALHKGCVTKDRHSWPCALNCSPVLFLVLVYFRFGSWFPFGHIGSMSQ
jgi:hypothetical protein